MSRVLPFLIGLLLLLCLGNCSKGTPNSPERDVSSGSEWTLSSSSWGVELPSHIQKKTWEVGTRWLVEDSLPQGDTLLLGLAVEVGHQYRIQWDDSCDGSDSYSADLYVNVLHSDSTRELYWWLDEDNGYQVSHSVQPQEDTLWVLARAFRAGSFALRVLDLGIVASSSSSSLMVSFPCSADSPISSAVSSSSVAELPSSSSSFILSSSSEVSSSSSVPGVYGSITGGLIPVSSEWTLVLRNSLDTQQFKIPCAPGDQLWVDWMEAGSSFSMKGWPLATINVSVAAFDGTLPLWGGAKDSVSTAPVVTMVSDTLRLSITANATGSTLGFFYLRVRKGQKIVQPVTEFHNMFEDTLQRGDTVLYHVPTQDGYQYATAISSRGSERLFAISWGELGASPVNTWILRSSSPSLNGADVIPSADTMELQVCVGATSLFLYGFFDVPLLGTSHYLPSNGS